jgi:hypothetical protein
MIELKTGVRLVLPTAPDIHKQAGLQCVFFTLTGAEATRAAPSGQSVMANRFLMCFLSMQAICSKQILVRFRNKNVYFLHN